MTLKEQCIEFMNQNPEEFINRVMKTVTDYDLNKILDDGTTFSQTEYTRELCYKKFLSWEPCERWIFLWGYPLKIKKISNTQCRIVYTVAKAVYYKTNMDNGSYNFKNCSSSYDSIKFPYPGLTLMENSFVIDVTEPQYRKYIKISY